MTRERFTVEHRPAESRYVLLDHGDAATPDARPDARPDTAPDARPDAAGGAPAPVVVGEEEYVDVEHDGVTERVLIHTGVSDDYAGQGLASRLVRAVVDDVVARGFAIVPVCPYVRAWLPRHPEYEAHVVARRPEHLDAIRARG